VKRFFALAFAVLSLSAFTAFVAELVIFDSQPALAEHEDQGER
jgi:hypothetical protein